MVGFPHATVVLLIPAYSCRALYAVGKTLTLKLLWQVSHCFFKQKNGRFQVWPVTKNVFFFPEQTDKTIPYE